MPFSQYLLSQCVLLPYVRILSNKCAGFAQYWDCAKCRACYDPKEHEYSYCNAPGWYCFMYVGGSVHSHSALFTGAMLCVCVLLKNRNRAPQHVNTSGLPQTFTFKDSNALQRHRRRRRRRRPPPPPPPPMLPQTTTREATTNTQTKAYSKTSSGVVALCEPGGGPGRPNSECSVSVAFGALIFETFSLTKWGSWRG